MKKLTLSAITLAMASMLSACGSSGEGDYIPSDTVEGPVTETPSNEQKPSLTGYFGHKIENLRYRSVSSVGVIYEGRTGQHGDFRYNEDDTVTFYLGDFKLGSVINERFVSPALFDSAIAIMSDEIPTSAGVDLSACEVEDEVEDEGSDDGSDDGDSGSSDEEVDLPPQCDDEFPESGVAYDTKVMFSALFDANRDVDNEILDGMYIDKDEDEIAEAYFDAKQAASEDHDYLTLLSRHSLAPKAGNYLAEITPTSTHGTNGTLCLAGDVSAKLVYSDSVEFNSGSMSMKDLIVDGQPVYGYEQLRSRNIYSAFSFVKEADNEFTYSFNLNSLGELVGSYTDNLNGCSGAIAKAK